MRARGEDERVREERESDSQTRDVGCFLCGFSVELRVEVVPNGEPRKWWPERWRRRPAAKDLWFEERARTQSKITRVISHRLCGTYLEAGE